MRRRHHLGSARTRHAPSASRISPFGPIEPPGGMRGSPYLPSAPPPAPPLLALRRRWPSGPTSQSSGGEGERRESGGRGDVVRRGRGRGRGGRQGRERAGGGDGESGSIDHGAHLRHHHPRHLSHALPSPDCARRHSPSAACHLHPTLGCLLAGSEVGAERGEAGGGTRWGSPKRSKAAIADCRAAWRVLCERLKARTVGIENLAVWPHGAAWRDARVPSACPASSARAVAACAALTLARVLLEVGEDLFLPRGKRQGVERWQGTEWGSAT